MLKFSFLTFSLNSNTVNLASRMESTSEVMKIQCSDLTGRILNDSPHVVFATEKRTENGVAGVHVKGKGLTYTWWIKSANKRKSHRVRKLFKIRDNEIRDNDIEMCHPSQSEHISPHEYELNFQYTSLSNQPWRKIGQNSNELVSASADKNIMIERCAAILNARLADIPSTTTGNGCKINPEVGIQLYSFVSQIESRYNDVEYHSFEHASHVMISMNSLLYQLEREKTEILGAYGVYLKDPWITFVLLLAALVHDVCHTGKSNKILRDQQHFISKQYPKHYAERLSIDTAIELLFSTEFTNLREAFLPDAKSNLAFVRLFFCSLLITDIAHPDTVQGGITRFYFINAVKKTYQEDNKKADQETVYDPNLCPLNGILETVCLQVATREEIEQHRKEMLTITKSNLELCVVSENLMQTCDVAHLMQDWENYIKWNFRLYKELLVCHRAGLVPDPSINWVEGQRSFVEYYVIPLAKRTERVMGIFANLQIIAKENNERWEREGSMILEIFVSGIQDNETEDVILNRCFSLNYLI